MALVVEKVSIVKVNGNGKYSILEEGYCTIPVFGSQREKFECIRGEWGTLEEARQAASEQFDHTGYEVVEIIKK
jgi:hypothetical protein